MNKITRILAIVMAIAMVFSMTACGHEHQWTEANCTTPKTCSGCNETEGEALGHTWVDATCITPKTCSACGVTEGEALGHTWIEANYQVPKTCSVCAVTEGEPMVTYFEESGLEERLLDKSGEYEMELPCAVDDTKTTAARVTIEDYQTIVSDETHEAMDGYEWKILTIKQHFDDENARKYGGNLGMYLWANKYSSGTAEEDADNTGLFEEGMSYPVEWNGVEYPDGLLHIREDVGEWMEDDAGSKYIDIVVTVSIRVPAGYDGFVFGLEKPTWAWPAGTYLHEVITDNTLLFCLD